MAYQITFLCTCLNFSLFDLLLSYIAQKCLWCIHLQRAIELNPKDATSIHLLGYWYRIIYLFVYMFVCYDGTKYMLLQESISGQTCQTSPNFVCMLLVVVAWSYCGIIAIRVLVVCA